MRGLDVDRGNEGSWTKIITISGKHVAGDIFMELHISDEKTKELLSEVVVELLKTKKNLLYDVIIEALEDVGLANAIAEERKNEFVSEDEIFSILDGNSK
ncbi:MAG: hypothetical protein WBP54_12480 [Pelodictyon phaeoclathratiforme]